MAHRGATESSPDLREARAPRSLVMGPPGWNTRGKPAVSRPETNRPERGGPGPGRLAMAPGVHYNLQVTMPASSSVQKYVFPAFLAICALALGGASCDQKSAASPEARDVVRAMDKAEGKPEAENDAKNDAKPDGKQDPQAAQAADSPEPATAPAVVDETPIPGVDVSKLDQAKAKRFYTLAATLASPCGAAHSLRTSLTEDKTCKRAPFAARYVVEMLSDEASDSEVKELYELRYKKAGAPKTFQLDGVPHKGPADAPVKVVEFFDYGCPTCKVWVPILEEALAGFPDQAVLFYKQFPLPSHVNSKPAAQAALAAHQQGKFEAMHKLLFVKAPAHREPELMQYAQSLGLDMARFKADYASALYRVQADITDGDKAGVGGTPTVYINGRMYEGPAHPKYVRMWIEEELAVNR